MCVHLVGGFNHLEKHWSMGRIVPYIMENKKCSKPPTRYNKSINVYTYVMLSSASIIPHTIEHWKIATLKPSASEPTWPIPQNPMRCHNCPFSCGQDTPKITVQSTNLRQNLQCLASLSWGFPCHISGHGLFRSPRATKWLSLNAPGRSKVVSAVTMVGLSSGNAVMGCRGGGCSWQKCLKLGSWLRLIRKNGKSRKHTRNIVDYPLVN